MLMWSKSSCCPSVVNYYKKKTLENFPNEDHVLFFTSVFVFSIFISTALSIPFWKLVPGLSTILFPWRWLIISTIAVAALVGISFDTLSFTNLRNYRTIRVAAAIFLTFLLITFYLSSVYLTAKEPMQQRDLERTLSDRAELIEYRPIWLQDREKDFSQERGTFPVVFKEGHGTVDIMSWKSQSRLIKSIASTASNVRISTFYYPGWTAMVNGKEIPIGIEKESGAMLLSLPAGENMILLEFRDTSLRRIAKWVSVISLIAAMSGLIVERYKRRT